MTNLYDKSVNNELSLPLSTTLSDHQTIRPMHSGRWLTLVDMIRNMQGFRAIILEHNNPAYRDSLIEQLNHNVTSATTVNLTEFTDFGSLESELFSLAESAELPNLIHLINLESLDDEFYHDLLKGINYHRELIAERLQTNILLWCIGNAINDMATIAPDFWAWREQSIDFSLPIELPTRWEGDWQQTHKLEKEKKQQRIDEILQYLATTTADEPKVSQADLLHELANLYQTIGQMDKSKQWLEQALAMFTKLSEKHAQARVQRDLLLIRYQQDGNPDIVIDELENTILPLFIELKDPKEQVGTYHVMADILISTGHYDKALSLLNNHILPINKQLGSIREIAIGKSKIADILELRGELDEALAIRQNEQLSVYEKLGDMQSMAITKGKISDILQSKGKLDRALAIRQNEVLPIFEKLGDIQLVALTKGRIADILQSRGELDKALVIRQNEEIPVFEKLGDIREIAISKEKIADILYYRGELDKALSIKQNEVLPVFEKLGDIRAIAVTKGQIADIFYSRGELDKALAIRQDDVFPVYEKLGDIRAIAVTRGKIADIFYSKGELEKALVIIQNEELPVYEKLGDIYSIAVTKGKIADILWRKDSHKNAQLVRDYLLEAMNIFNKMGLTNEKEWIENQLREKGLPRTGKVIVKNTFAQQNSILSQINGFSQKFKSKR